MRRKTLFALLTLAMTIGSVAAAGPAAAAGKPAATGTITANGWYEGEEIYYLLPLTGGIETGFTQRGQNDLYLIGGDRAFQGNVAEFIPGEAGYTPHWNVNVVNTAPGKTLADILASPFVSELYATEGVLFDDAEDILAAQAAGLVTIAHPGVVVLCPVVSEEAAEAPGNTQLSEDFPAFPPTF
ncbi:MAG: hypothetical protein WEC14_00985 [Chloroflexota bacterium]